MPSGTCNPTEGAIVSTVFKTLLTDKIPRTAGTLSSRFARPEGLSYQAGQWFVITIPSSDGPLVKHFTYSSSPSESFLEFTTRLTGSDFKDALASLEIGTEVEMEAPFGRFVLRPEFSRVTFLTAGIGITPVRSILRFMADTGTALPATLIYGNSTEEAITFRDELEETARRLPSLQVVHVLSSPTESWEGRRGHIDAALVRSVVADPSASPLYISGPPLMVEAMRALAAELGVPSGLLVLERLEGYREFLS
jgi:ferredoxin-NADP reductase